MTPEEKILYSFTVTRKVEKPRKETSVDESGAEITKTIKEIVEEPVKVVIQRPSRRQDDLAEEEYAVQFSRYLKKGLLTKAMLANKYSDSGGMMSETDAKDYAKLLKELSDARDDYQKQAAFAKTNKKKEKQVADLGEKVISLTQEVLRIENRYQNLFELTAETKAETQRLLWYALHLSFIEEDEKLVPIYSGEDLEAKKETYYAKEEEPDDVYAQIRQKLWLVYAIWQFNRNATSKDIEEMLKTLEAPAKSD